MTTDEWIKGADKSPVLMSLNPDSYGQVTSKGKSTTTKAIPGKSPSSVGQVSKSAPQLQKEVRHE